MKILLINGSPHPKGCTYTALCEIADTLRAEGVESEIFHLGTAPLRSCVACGGCKTTHRCVFDDGFVNELIEKAEHCDGFVFGSPVHYAAASGTITSCLGRLAYAGGVALRGKPGAAIVSCRRGGSSAALDQLQKYFPILGMPLVPGQYWPMVHGHTPDDVRKDLEGLQIMRTLARNMAWMVKCFALGRENNLPYPQREAPVVTNFIR